MSVDNAKNINNNAIDEIKRTNENTTRKFTKRPSLSDVNNIVLNIVPLL